MSYHLFLDDFREPIDVVAYFRPEELRSIYEHPEWVIVRDYNEFVDCIRSNGIPLVVSFDHDLALEHYHPAMNESDEAYNELIEKGIFKEKTGYHCALWFKEYMEQNGTHMTDIYCHSMNPVGKKNILKVFGK